MCHPGNDAQCQLQAGIALQGCGGMVFWAHLFPLLSPFHLLLSKSVLANDLFVSCTKGVGGCLNILFCFVFVFFYLQMYLLNLPVLLEIY